MNKLPAALLAILATAACSAGGPAERSTWTGPSGPPLVAHAGEKHCDWESVTILRLDDDRQFVRDPEGVIDKQWLESAYDPHATLPADAKDTGYRHDGQRLWLDANGSAAYVVDGKTVEQWPRTRRGWGCD
ncbi:hypothetical protein [Dactylosporangium sp. CA-139066]|uniref:hypothetical protein n=1 Tax=Dactylosporangium sp. CA-139066 TaxID=3239930 RepID=UPI003D89C013